MQENGNHYVIGDLHGRYDLYEKVISKLSRKDTLFVLGDVIDREKDGIRILRSIMARKEIPAFGPRVVFLMGNHEMQFLDCTEIIKKHRLNMKTIREILKIEKMRDALKEEGTYELKLRSLNLKLTEEQCNRLYVWLECNGGMKTLESFYDPINKRFNLGEIERISNFLQNSFVCYNLVIKDRNYLLVHSLPPKEDLWMQVVKNCENIGILYKAFMREVKRHMLEDRDDNEYKNALKYGFTKTICGHTPSKDGKHFEGERIC